MSPGSMPSVFATISRPDCGVWLAAQISIRPSRKLAVQFIGSGEAWARKG